MCEFFSVWFVVQFIGLLPLNVGLVSVNGQIAKRRMRFGIIFTLFLLLSFRVVRLSTVVYQALRLTWALVPWFVTFWMLYLNVISQTKVWQGREFSVGEQLVTLFTVKFRGLFSFLCPKDSWSGIGWDVLICPRYRRSQHSLKSYQLKKLEEKYYY